ncbi:MAG: hypothetical protein J6Y60_04285 [Treponema sp.]|nr:hypothetical protein [Treponema sp.]
MSDTSADIFAGRKTFFIAPDTSLLPEAYMEDYLNRGYETYIIGDDRYCSLRRKVELIISLFSDAILFFYIDSEIHGIEWPKYIYQLQRTYGDKVMIGVLYSKRKSEEEKSRLERFYLFDVGIPCGCIALEYQYAKNFALVDRILYVNQAGGRRKTVRAICDDKSEITFSHKNTQYKGTICDISLNHFSCIFDESLAVLPISTKITDFMLVVNGVHIHSDGTLLMQRKTPEGILNIFVFTRKDGTNGLDSDTEHRLSQKIYQIVTTRTKTVLQTVFATAGKEEEEAIAAAKFQAKYGPKNQASQSES